MSDNTSEKRKYLRIERKIPIDFAIVDLQEMLLPGVGWQKGYTVNVSHGGICIESETLRESTIKYICQQQILLNLKIHVPLNQKPLGLVGQVSWYQKIEEPTGVRLIIGLKFRSIKQTDLDVLLRQTSRFKYLFKTIIILTLIFLGSLVYHFLLNKPS